MVGERRERHSRSSRHRSALVILRLDEAAYVARSARRARVRARKLQDGLCRSELGVLRLIEVANAARMSARA